MTTTTIKFLCSYNGKILPRYPDGKLRYYGGQTRVLSVDRSISFSELLVKLGQLCGTSVTLRCQLPTEDLDALVSITCDEDLVNLIEEYDRISALESKPLKIRAFLRISSTVSLSTGSASRSSSSTSTTTHDAGSPKSPVTVVNRCFYNVSKLPVVRVPVPYRFAGRMTCHAYGNPSRSYIVQ